MHIRSSVVNADPRRIDDGIAFVQEQVLPFVARLHGSLGLQMLVNRASGRTVTSTAWRSATAMEDSLDSLSAARSQAARALGGVATVEHWEVAEVARVRADEVGFASRWTRLALHPADVELLTETYRTTSVPAFSLLPGYCGAELLVHPSAGLAMATVTFESRRLLEDTRREAVRIREDALEKAHARAVEVVESEVAIAGFTDPADWVW